MFADKRNQFFSGVRAEVHKIEEREQIQSFEFLSSALWLKSWIWPDLATTKKTSTGTKNIEFYVVCFTRKKRRIILQNVQKLEQNLKSLGHLFYSALRR